MRNLHPTTVKSIPKMLQQHCDNLGLQQPLCIVLEIIGGHVDVETSVEVSLGHRGTPRKGTRLLTDLEVRGRR